MTISKANGTGMATASHLLRTLLAPDPPPFALIRRHGITEAPVELLVGRVTEVTSLAALPLPGPGDDRQPEPAVLAVIPYRQVSERGYACHDDGAPILVLTADQRAALPADTVLSQLPGQRVATQMGAFDIKDEEYAGIVDRIIGDEIRSGEGSNFVIKRSFRAVLPGYRPETALAVFRHLLVAESNAYWTFVVYTGDHTFVGASPEQHVQVSGGIARMNPISGTYRYPPAGPDLAGVLRFLADQKETDELCMVLDEELKMLARVCDGGARIRGPYLREMARLAHTEYRLHGPTGRDVRDVLRETMFAPTVVGSPLENACRVIARNETEGRAYYGGVLALLGRDGAGQPWLDSAILIRTADIHRSGTLRVDVGATLVRHSQPAAEVAETWAKAEALLTALGVGREPGGRGPRPGAGRLGPSQTAAPASVAAHPQVAAALARRNDRLSWFWLDRAADGPPVTGTPPSGRVLVVDAEDMFTGMLGHQMRSIGLDVTIRACGSVLPGQAADFDLVVLGPGPGDPRDGSDPRIARLRELIGVLLAQGTPFMAECLSHQVLADMLGLPLVRRDVPHQGAQREIDLFGRPELVGFYNSYVARHTGDRLAGPDGGAVHVCRDPRTGEVHALRGPGFASAQFHLESVLTRRGPQIMARLLGWARQQPDEPCRTLALTDGERA
jgi:phenazine biosynthesis protein phzE